MAIESDVLRVYEAGKMTVIGLGRTDKLGDMDIVECHAEILELLKLHNCSVLVIDLMDVNYVPSSVLGMLASLTRTGVEVHLYNISGEVRRVLEITRLDQLFTIQEHLLCD
jgi:anti-anti-sigma factor